MVDWLTGDQNTNTAGPTAPIGRRLLTTLSDDRHHAPANPLRYPEWVRQRLTRDDAIPE
jgi:hypothetical protein